MMFLVSFFCQFSLFSRFALYSSDFPLICVKEFLNLGRVHVVLTLKSRKCKPQNANITGQIV